ncbi:MAG TPA: hypothetical protein P5268_03315 [Candidatus Marinimicrobia bacterium]|nr:hypothetical protein [Candidatus Neomarinimicrobiota bacterium]HRS52311.1 hypothetical protein [Candidatus Neomarinimicrobiota bacterium]HRU92049.1 hypothetical protein [Candidatus Neomarinimicrobiota bacterium]
MSYSYRIQIKFPKDFGLICNESSYYINGNENLHPITIRSLHEDQNLSESSEYVFVGDGFDSYSEAEEEGKSVLNSIIRSFVKLGIGIDYGIKGPSAHITEDGLEHFRRQFCVERLLEGGLGLKVYKTLPHPKFATPEITTQVHTPIVKFVDILIESKNKYREFTDKELLSIKLFNSSFFEEIPESRFLLLVMAVETLIICEPRSEEVIEHVNNIIKMTNSNDKICPDEKKSIINSLSWLKLKSIGQAGRELAKGKLGNKKYYNLSAPKFFTYCYEVRSNLVHSGRKPPDYKELGELSNELIKFVSNLLFGCV